MSSSAARSALSASRWESLFATAWIALACALFGAAALSVPAEAAPSATASAEAEAEAFEEEVEGEEWELEIEGEEEAEEEGFEMGGPTVLPSECILSTADPSVVAVPGQSHLQLALRYTSEAPVKVGVEYWLKGGKGALQLGSAKRHLGKRGVLRMNRRLDERELAKVRAARLIMLRIEVPGVDPYCKPFLTFRLNAKQQGGSRTTFSQPH
jgi:hypothetical protein